MSVQNAYNAYKQNSVTTASPGELTLMLYNGCLKFIHQGKKAIDEKNIEKRNTNITKAQAIITELMSTLNMDIAISTEMLALYEYIQTKLIEANIQSSIEALDEVEELVTEFRDTWKEVIQINRKKQFTGDSV